MLELPGVYPQTSDLATLALCGAAAALEVLIEIELIGAWLCVAAHLTRMPTY